MTTFQELIHDARHHLMTGKTEIINVLDVGVSPGDDSLQFRYTLQGVSVGSRLAIGLEEYHVVEPPSGTAPQSTVTVIPGFNGSVQAAHTAGDLIYVNPQFTSFRISRAVNRCLESLSGDGLFQVKAVEFDYNPSQAGYNISATDLLDIWRIRYDEPGPANDWPVLRPQDYHLDNSPNAAEFPGGRQLVLHRGASPGQTVRVSYRAEFAPLVDLSDDVTTDSGLQDSAHDIPPFGAAIRLLAGRDVKRSFLTQQPEPRRQEEVPPGAASQAMLPLVQQYYSAIDRELSVLHRLYPIQL